MLFKQKPKKQQRAVVMLPNKHLLQMLFTSSEGLPTSKDCYDLLWLANYGNTYIDCPKCSFESAYLLTPLGDKAHAVYECERRFCRNHITIALPFMTTKNNSGMAMVKPIAYWFKLAWMMQQDKKPTYMGIAREVGVAYETARVMVKKLEPYI